MGMEHNRPDGLYRGYFCGVCGEPGLSMVGNSEHGPGRCERNPGLVKILTYLNSKNATSEVMQGRCEHQWMAYNGDEDGKRIKFQMHPLNGKVWFECNNCGVVRRDSENEMAKYDQGGGCPCGLYKECKCDMAVVRNPVTSQAGTVTPKPGEPVMVAPGKEWETMDKILFGDKAQQSQAWDQRDALTARGTERTPNWGPKVGSGLSLSDKLKATLSALEAANIKSLEEKANADIAKIERERADIAHFVEGIKNSMVQNIERGKVPLLKIEDHGRISWIQKAQKGNAPHQLYWNQMLQWFGKEKLRLEVIDAHDGVGMKSWLNVTVTPVDTVLTYRHGHNL